MMLLIPSESLCLFVIFLLLQNTYDSMAKRIQDTQSTSPQLPPGTFARLNNTSENTNIPNQLTLLEQYYKQATDPTLKRFESSEKINMSKRTTNEGENAILKRRGHFYAGKLRFPVSLNDAEIKPRDPLLFIAYPIHSVEFADKTISFPSKPFHDDRSYYFQGTDFVEADHHPFDANPIDVGSKNGKFSSKSVFDRRATSLPSQISPHQMETTIEKSNGGLHLSHPSFILRKLSSNINRNGTSNITTSSSIDKEPVEVLRDHSNNHRTSSNPFNDDNITWEPYPFSGVFDHLMALNNSIIILPSNNVTGNRNFRNPFLDKNQRNSNQNVNTLRGGNNLGGSNDNNESSARNEGRNNSDINNPEEFRVSLPPEKSVFQTPIGGRCYYLESNSDGVCVALSECPTLQTLADQFQNRQIKEFFQTALCRMTETEMFFCCPSYQSSAWLPGGRSSLVPMPSQSPYPAPLFPAGQCGQVKVRPGRIRGGVVVEDGEWPWLATLGRPIGGSVFASYCSGSLITRRHVMTAAHCQRGASLDQPTHVRFGETDLLRNTVPGHQEFLIASFHAPLHYFFFAINDILLLTLDKDVTFTDYVQPGCLPVSLPTAPVPGDSVTVVGYGLLEETTPETAVEATGPHSLEVTVRETRICQQAYSQVVPQLYISDDRTFCEGGEANRSACKGDSGGPVNLWDEATEAYVIVGVTNARFGCGVEDAPSIHLRVGAFLPWILGVIGG